MWMGYYRWRVSGVGGTGQTLDIFGVVGEGWGKDSDRGVGFYSSSNGHVQQRASFKSIPPLATQYHYEYQMERKFAVCE